MICALLWLACAGDEDGDDRPPAPTDTPAPVPTPVPTGDTEPTGTPYVPPQNTAPVVVLVIGDGMGFPHLIAGSQFVTGSDAGLTIQGLDVSGTVRTGSLTGIADSASGGTALACGVATYNGVIGQDRDGVDVENLVELAQGLGWATGIVTTSELPHATPAVFSAHHPDRDQEPQIAAKQLTGAADVMLGGGTKFYTDLVGDIEKAGWPWVETSLDLASQNEERVWGAFAPGHLPYVALVPPDPGLPDLVEDALARLQGNEDGLFLMIEGARIDHASHGNNIDLVVEEVAALDQAVQAVLDWGAERPRPLTLVVTADHECGGLGLEAAGSIGVPPDASWRWGSHTNADVPLFATGPGTETFEGALVDQREVHARLVEQMTGTYTAPQAVLIPDGRHDDLSFRAVDQLAASSVGDTLGRLQAMLVDADDRGMSVGLEGVFPWLTHTVVLLIDIDYGQSTGPASMIGATSGGELPAEIVIDGLRLGTAPAGFGTDVVVVSAGGAETPYSAPLRGAFGLRPPWGTTADVGPLRTGINYAVGVRTFPTDPIPVQPGLGYEVTLEWAHLFPNEPAGQVPPNTRIGIIAALVGLTGTDTTNQLLPPLSIGSAAPGTNDLSPVPGAVVFSIDPDGDGLVNPTAPTVVQSL